MALLWLFTGCSTSAGCHSGFLEAQGDRNMEDRGVGMYDLKCSEPLTRVAATEEEVAHTQSLRLQSGGMWGGHVDQH